MQRNAHLYHDRVCGGMIVQLESKRKDGGMFESTEGNYIQN